MDVTQPIASLLDFLLGLLSDPQARAAFEQDPLGTLEHHGFGSLCGQDVRDARAMLTEHRSVSVAGTSDAQGEAGGETEVVREINYITKNYTVENGTQTDEADETDETDEDQEQHMSGGDDITTITNITYDNDVFYRIDDRDVVGDDNNVNYGTISASGGSAVVVGDGNDVNTMQDNSHDLDIRYRESFNTDSSNDTYTSIDSSETTIYDQDGVDVDGNGNTTAGGDVTIDASTGKGDDITAKNGTVETGSGSQETGKGDLDASTGKGNDITAKDATVETGKGDLDASTGKGDDISAKDATVQTGDGNLETGKGDLDASSGKGNDNPGNDNNNPGNDNNNPGNDNNDNNEFTDASGAGDDVGGNNFGTTGDVTQSVDHSLIGLNLNDALDVNIGDVASGNDVLNDVTTLVDGLIDL